MEINFKKIDEEKVKKLLESSNIRIPIWDKSLIIDFANCLFGTEEAGKALQNLFEVGSFDSAAEVPKSSGNLPEPWAVVEDFSILLGPLAYHSDIQYYDMPHSVAVHHMIKFVKGLRDGMSKTSKYDPQQAILDTLEYSRPYQQHCLELLDDITRKGMTSMYHFRFLRAKYC